MSAYEVRDTQPCILFGDAAELRRLAARLGLRPEALQAVTERELSEVPLGRVGLLDTGAVPQALIAQHGAHPVCGRAQLLSLEQAARSVLSGKTCALVTGPTSKAAINAAGIAFTGQTEFLAALDQRRSDDVSMLFLGPRLKVGLVTTHLSIASVPKQVTGPRVARTIRHLAQALCRLKPGQPVTLEVAGLNPHAGEGGLFGGEEGQVIAPAVAELREELEAALPQVRLGGPAPAESVFRAAARGDLDGVVAMFHDQATIASKLLDWGAAVNTTWGLSFVRTSVDHGVAYDAAGSRSVDASGMRAALAMALRLAQGAHG